MPKSTIPTPPDDLSPGSQALWAQIHRGWALDDSARLLLTVALRAFDRGAAARALVERDGLMLKGRAHPALTVVKDADGILLKAWRQLGLEMAPPAPMGRPPGRGPA